MNLSTREQVHFYHQQNSDPNQYIKNTGKGFINPDRLRRSRTAQEWEEYRRLLALQDEEKQFFNDQNGNDAHTD